MANDSSTGGLLTPTGTQPLEGAALEAIFQQLFVGLTGLPGNYVRPRWQWPQPKQPDASVDWCAVGISKMNSDAFPYIAHDQTGNSGNGIDDFMRQEELEVLATFYGPDAMLYAQTARDSLYIAQNNEWLRQYGIGLIEVQQAVAMPEIVNEQWIRRFDLPMRFRRVINLQYSILTVVSAPDQIIYNP